MDIIEKIFGSAARVKIMKLFLFNPTTPFDIRDISTRSKVSLKSVRTEIKVLADICLVKPRSFYKDELNSKGKKKKVRGFVLNESFSHLSPLKSFLVETSALQPKDIIKKMSKVGKIKLLVTSGVFIQEPESRVDMLVVGDGLKKTNLESAIRKIESELGREIMYSYFETPDFKYRLGMFDKLIRDILDFPHQKIVDKIGIN